MSFLQILGVLAGLIAIVQLFLIDWPIGKKLLLLLVLALVSVLLLKCSPQSLTGDNGTTTGSTTVQGKPTEQPLETIPPSATSKPNILRLFDANVVSDRYVKQRQGSYKDSFGNIYKQEVYFSSDFYGGDITFSPLGEYNYFRGVIAVSEFYDYPDEQLKIEIFADGNSIYYTTLTKTTEPIPFDLNITSARQIKIVSDGSILIGDGEFYN